MLIARDVYNQILKSKDDEIAALQSEVAFLRSMVSGFANPSASPFYEKTQIEANAVLSGSQEQIDLNTEPPLSDDIFSEREKLLSGTY